MKVLNIEGKAVFLITLYGLWLRFVKLMNTDLNGDEIFQFNNMVGELKPFWKHCLYGDFSAFPGEYILNFFSIQFFGLNKYGLAIPHIIVVILGFYLLYRICKDCFHLTFGTIIIFLLAAFHRELIYYSFYFRPYAVLPTLALGSFYFSYLIIHRYNFLSRRSKILIGLFFFIAMNYHAYGIMIVAFPLIYNIIIDRKLMTSARWRYIRNVLLVSVPVWIWYASFNFFSLEGMGGVKYVFEYIENPFIDLYEFFKKAVRVCVGFKPFYILGAMGFLTFILPHKDRLKQLIYILLLVVFPIILILLIDLKSKYWFVQRQFIWVFHFIIIYLGWCVECCWVSLNQWINNKRGERK